MFAGNNSNEGIIDYGVAFADVNLSQTNIRGEHSPGGGGWPTIKYFTPETGVEGARYEKKTELSMCAELGDRNRMLDYVEDYGNTVLCGADGTNCNEKELAYLEKMMSQDAEAQRKQLERLEGMTENASMKPELQDWAFRRVRMLKKLLKKDSSDDGSSSSSEEL
jgi:hypothetical protein